MTRKLLVVMIDGVSAEYVATCWGRLPHLAGLAARGLRVENLHSETLGTSLPGRASIVTGVTADISGIYANYLWDAASRRFRYASPDDLRVPTLPARLRSAGREAAALGYGMIRPEDADIFKAPWWIGEYVQRARDAQPAPSDASWLRAMRRDVGDRFRRMCAEAGYPHDWPTIPVKSQSDRLLLGQIADLRALEWAGIVAASQDAPDLILTEYVLPDALQHYAGYKSELAHWAIAQADAAVGMMLERMRGAGVLDSWNIAVMSDHGHSPIEKALHPRVLLPGVPAQCEGGSLLVAPRDTADLERITQTLAGYGCEPFHVDYVPADHRGQLAAFTAPPGVSFEDDNPDETEPDGKPVNVSSHGLRPGMPGDDRFAIFAGPDVPRGVQHEAAAIRIAPTLAKLLGLPLTDYPGAPLF